MLDLVIIGGGPAGLTAGIYAQRYMLDTVLLEKQMAGGQVAITDIIENWPGIKSITGMELSDRFREHAESLGLKIDMAEVVGIEDKGKKKIIKTTEGEIETRTVIIATGSRPKELGVPGEREFRGRGVSYCGTCDGPLFRDKRVLVVGGGDTAVKESIYLSRLVSQLFLVHRRDQLRAEKMLQERILSIENVVFKWNSLLDRIEGTDGVERAIIHNKLTGKEEAIDVDGIFVFVGIEPNTEFVDVEKDEWGFIKTNQDMETSVEGIFAAGDCRVKPIRQITTAVGDGAIAAYMVEQYVSHM